MPTRTVNQGFEKFHSNLTPSPYESRKATSHKNSIESKLKADFELNRVFYSGSAKNGTSISKNSDIDLFASIPTRKLRDNSATTLRKIKKSLAERFPSSSVFVDSPAVVCKFGGGDWDKIEVIPADYITINQGYNEYDIPDSNGGWMRSSPNAHNAYVREHDKRLGFKLKKLIRFAKAWSYYKNVPISSFYLELRITKLMESESYIDYSIDLVTVFSKLESCGLSAIQDPMGISGHVDACSSEEKKKNALSKVKTAHQRAKKAQNAADAGKIPDAFLYWNLLFDAKFPSFYH